MKKLFCLLAAVIALTAINVTDTYAQGFDSQARWGWQWRGQRPDRPHRPERPDRPGRPDPGWNHGGQNLSCAAFDNGWEEHFGGHASCGECLRKHGGCTERCSAITYVCHSDGIVGGYNETFEAYSQYSEFEARNDALNRCYQSGGRNCSVSRCENQQQIVSQRSCR